MSTSNRTARHVVLPDSLKQIALTEIRRRIFARELAPGARIDQEPLADEIGMSKIPVREALSALAAEGLVEMVPRRGAFVVPLSKADIEDHYWMLAHLSGRAAERAAENLSEESLAELERLIEQMETATDEQERARANFTFHSLINHAAESPRILAVLRTLGSPIPLEFYESNTEMAPEADAEHRNLLEALRSRSGPRARAAMEDHFLRGAQKAIEILDAQGFWQK
ncbi:GntR family transcriptional regulator [Nocardia sp. NPDC004068]|uniref:GntR family transcriptional regulator n=1 Tax=Nocardia sp. NPDC004068 TaxID=3364303 RepID=UPI00369D45A9